MVHFRLAQKLGWVSATLSMLACGGSSDDGVGPPQGAMCVSGSGSVQVTVGDNFFNSQNESVPVNGTVTWTWSGVMAHNVTFTAGPAPLPTTSCTQSFGSHSVTFTTAGNYDYVCTLHAGMAGSVMVTP